MHTFIVAIVVLVFSIALAYLAQGLIKQGKATLFTDVHVQISLISASEYRISFDCSRHSFDSKVYNPKLALAFSFFLLIRGVKLYQKAVVAENHTVKHINLVKFCFISPLCDYFMHANLFVFNLEYFTLFEEATVSLCLCLTKKGCCHFE